MSTDPLDVVLARLERTKKSGAGFSARCPAHDDTTPSLSIRHGANGGVVLKCHTGCSTEAVVSAIGLTLSDLFADTEPRQPSYRKPSSTTGVIVPPPGIAIPRESQREVASYQYRDEHGELLYEAVRYDPKAFRYRRPDGNGGCIWDIQGVQRVLYRLPEVLAAVRDGQQVWLVEGEKDADALAALGLPATTHATGAKGWRGEYAEPLAGASIVVVPDADDVGRSWAATAAAALLAVGCAVSVLALYPERDDGSDISDFLSVAKTPEMCTQAREFLERLVPDASELIPPYTPPRGGMNTNAAPPLRGPGDAIHSTTSRPIGRNESIRRFRTLRERQERGRVETEWICRGLLARGAVTLLAGMPKAGKSTFWFGLLAALQNGEPFLGFPTRQIRGAVMLTEENESSLWPKADRFGIDPDFLSLLTRNDDIRDPWEQVVERAADECREREAELLIVDTTRWWMRFQADEENKPGPWMDAMHALTAAIDPHVTTGLTAHLRKTPGEHGTAVAGSNALTGAVDIILELDHRSGETRRLRGTSRFEETPEDLVISLGDEGYASLGTTEEAGVLDGCAAVSAALSDEPTTVKQIAEATGFSEQKVGRLLTKIPGVHKTGKGVRNHACEYTLGAAPNTSFLDAGEREGLTDDLEGHPADQETAPRQGERADPDPGRSATLLGERATHRGAYDEDGWAA